MLQLLSRRCSVEDSSIIFVNFFLDLRRALSSIWLTIVIIQWKTLSIKHCFNEALEKALDEALEEAPDEAPEEAPVEMAPVEKPIPIEKKDRRRINE